MIECYKYIDKDLEDIKLNKWGWYLKNKKSMKLTKEYLRCAEAFTLYDGKPIAILGFHEYDKDKYDGCIIADECFGDNPKYAIKMKLIINCCIKKYNMKRVQTTSEDSPALNKWHKFLGFNLEKKHCLQHRGKPFNLWSMEWQ